MKKISVAIDGPSGAGKSTIARAVAKEFGFVYVDTGAIYRAVGLFALRKGISPKDVGAVKKLLREITIELAYKNGMQRILLNGEDVSDLIRTPEVSIYASDVSAIGEVRAFLLDLQRDTAKSKSVVMDGRDIGTVVLPDADVKIFLTASPGERARRRHEELLSQGRRCSYEEVLRDMRYRDRNDSARKSAPLKKADDAVEVDTTGNTLETSIRVITELIKDRLSL